VEHDAATGAGVGVVYGTSASTPTMAGLMALVVQATGERQGNPNPMLYGLARLQAAGGAAVFHDVTAGDNGVPGVQGYGAGAGYELATGLGSPDANALVRAWRALARRGAAPEHASGASPARH
jgi:subtilase family serine protease